MQTPSNELMSELLLGMRLFGVQFRRIEMCPAQGVGFSNEVGRAQFHFIGRGPVWLQGPGAERYRLDSGDAVLIPHGGPHGLLPAADARLADVQPLELGTHAELISASEPRSHQGAVVFSCCMALELGGMQPLVREMPAVLQVSTLLDTSPEIRPMLNAMEREALALQAGHMSILARLAEVVAALIVRAWVSQRLRWRYRLVGRVTGPATE